MRADADAGLGTLLSMDDAVLAVGAECDADADADSDEWISTPDAAALFDVVTSTIGRIGRGEAKNAEVRVKTLRESGSGIVRLYSRRDLERYFGGARRRAPEGVAGRESCVYVIVLGPETRPERVKVGCTTDLGGRLTTFRTVCPEASVLVSYPVPVICEGYVLVLAQALSDNSFSEVFDFNPESLPKFLDSLSQALAPILD